MVWAAQAPLILSRNSSVDSVTTSPLDDEAASSDEHPAPPPAATIKHKTARAGRCNLVRLDADTSAMTALWSMLIGCSSCDE